MGEETQNGSSPNPGLKSPIARQDRQSRRGAETGEFAISRKFPALTQKQFLFWDLRSKKAIASGCNPRGCRLQGEV